MATGSGRKKTAGDSVFKARNITPSDDTAITLGGVTMDAAAHPTAVLVQTLGAVALQDLDGDSVVYTDLAPGVWHRIAFAKVLDTGTTITGAGNIKAGWTG